MMNEWKRFGLSALLALSVGTAPVLAGPIENPPDKPEPDKSAAILKQIQDLKDSIANLDKQIRKSLKTLETDTSVQVQNAQGDINALKDLVADLRRDVEELRRRLPQPGTSASLYPPGTNGTGRVRLVNTYMDPMTILVNNRSYRLAPGEAVVTGRLPAGTFTFQVLGVQLDMQTRTLAPNETYTITVFPRG